MGRFSSAKANSDSPTVLQRAINYLIELLDKGYSTSLTINGKKILIEISPAVGIQITSDGTKVFGIDNSGNLFSSRISDSENPEFSASIGSEVVGGKTYRGIFGFLKDYSETTPIFKIFSSGTHATGCDTVIEFEAIKIRMELDPGVPPNRFNLEVNGHIVLTCDDYGFVIYDDNDNPRISSGSTDCVMWSPNTNNIVGVDNTGVFKSIGGVKTYL